MVFSAIVYLLLLLSTTQFVTDIYIDCPEGIDKKVLKAELEECGLKPGVFKKTIDRKIIRDHIMQEIDEVAYLSINVKGTNVFVTVTKKDDESTKVANSNYCNIIASKNGIIEKVIARRGEAVVQVGDIVKTGDKMPAFTLTSTVNGTVNSADLKGKVVLINIFATWCGPCQSELAEVQKTLWPKYKDNKDFRMIVIGREHTDEELTAYNKRKEFTFPLYPDPKREVTNKFASQYIPRSYLINKEGKVISATVGYQKEEMDKLMKEIDKALK